jgi:hypothetical protein
VVRAVPVVVALLLGQVAVAAAGISPADQRLASSLTLRLRDVPSGWRTGDPPSTRFQKVGCATAPPIEDAVTGFSRSAELLPIHHQVDKRYVASETRVFSSVALARRWFEWAGAGESACVQKANVAFWRTKFHYRVYGLVHARESFPLTCSSCPAHELSAWQVGYTTVIGSPERWFIDWVVVRRGRAVVAFYLFSAIRPFGPDAQRFVAAVIAR